MSRLDVLLVQQGYFETREKAQLAIRSGKVRLDGLTVCKPGQAVRPLQQVAIEPDVLPYVSRGGLKLERAIEQFALHWQGKRVLDVGASTGGFTDVCLRAGAQVVYAMDVGSNQLHPSLRQHPQVRAYEKIHIRDFGLEQLDGRAVDVLVTDLSFISLRLVFAYFGPLLQADGQVVALIKPQFEFQEKKHFKNGIVREARYHVQAIEQVCEAARQTGFYLQQLTHAPVYDTEKNIEFLALFVRHSCTTPHSKAVVARAHEALKEIKRK